MRYFFFTYTQITETKDFTGNLYFEMEKFPSHKLLTDSAKDKTGNRNPVVFTSWNEFESEEDYKSFMGDELDLSSSQSQE